MKQSPIFLNSFKLICCLFGALIFVSDSHSSSLPDSMRSTVESHYVERVNYINQTLTSNQDEFEATPQKLADFVDNSLLPLWNSQKTLRGLFGKKNWLALTNKDHVDLEKGFNDTIQRYVQEGFALYDGQQIEFVGIKLNKKQTRGLLTIKVIPNVLPEFDVNFKVAYENDQWQLYDILVQGVSYVTLKRDSFRNQYKNQGISEVLKAINEKNKGYIESNKAIQPKNEVASANK